jgi:hypothetical protein
MIGYHARPGSQFLLFGWLVGLPAVMVEPIFLFHHYCIASRLWGFWLGLVSPPSPHHCSRLEHRLGCNTSWSTALKRIRTGRDWARQCYEDGLGRVKVCRHVGIWSRADWPERTHSCSHRKKITPWPQSASELYRPSDRRLSAKSVPSFLGKRVPRDQRDGSPTAVL